MQWTMHREVQGRMRASMRVGMHCSHRAAKAVRRGTARTLLLMLLGTATACGDGGTRATGANSASPSGVRASHATATDVPRVESLAFAGGGAAMRAYAVNASRSGATGGVTGSVTSTMKPSDTTIVPTHDLLYCPRFTERSFPSRDGGVGNSIVWIAGVAAGPPDDAPRRATITLDDCQLEPRVQRIAAGGTLLVKSQDAVTSRLRFTENDPLGALRATVSFTDAGQVVPTQLAVDSAGIVAIRDDRHPWVRGYLAVTPHPFVAVTDERGAFHFEGVPTGTYTLVVWHERFGTHTESVTVRGGVDTKVSVSLP